MPAWSRAGRFILWLWVAARGRQGSPGAGTPGTPAPPEPPGPPAALPGRARSSLLGLLGCEPGREHRAVPGTGSASKSIPRARELQLCPGPQARHIPEGAVGNDGELGWFLGGRGAVQNVPLKGRGSILLKRE